MTKKNDDVFDYLKWRGDLTFEQSPLNPVDAVIFCQLSYLNFDGILQSSFRPRISLEDLWSRYINSHNIEIRDNLGAFIGSRPGQVFKACAETARFKDVQVCGYETVFDYERVQQSGTICFIYKGNTVIAFKGTDDSFLGWKEDCYLAVNQSIASHETAMNYISKALKFTTGKITLIGHSKGGNVAMFTAVNGGKKLKRRLSAVYDFDGPGFSADFYKTKNFLDIKDKIHAYVPHRSFVGMVFEKVEGYKIVKSSASAIDQHSPLNWYIRGTEFEYEESLAPESKYFHNSVSEWSEKVSEEEKLRFFNILFELIWSSEAKTISELDKKKATCIRKIGKTFIKLEDKDRKFVRSFVHVMINVLRENVSLLKLIEAQLKLHS